MPAHPFYARIRVAGLLSTIVVLGAVGTARAAEVRLHAQQDCVEVGSIVDEVEGVIGQPLAAVSSPTTFEVDITRNGSRSWRVRLGTSDAARAAPGVGSATARATRELDGASCAEVASAAAVAIAISIQAAAADPQATAAAAATAPPLAPEPAHPPAAVAATAPTPSGRSRPRLLAALVASGDAGSLPQVGVGGELNVAVAFDRLRVSGLVSAFLPRDASTVGPAGGQFTLMFGGLLACGTRQLARATLAGCLGGELGRLAGEGTGATHPRLGSALWAAGRAEVGLTLPVGPGWAFVVRGGVAVPGVRPRFEVNGTQPPVHEPAAVAGRLAAGVELAF